MTALLTNFPWWLTAFLVLSGLVMLTYGNHRQQLNIRSSGLAVVSLALLLGAARFLIETPIEKCERRTREMVDYADQQDWKKMQSLMDADTTVDLGSVAKGASGSDIATTADQLAKKVGLTHVAFYSHQSEQLPGKIIVKIIAAYTVKDTGDAGHNTGWEFDYSQSGDKWDLQKIKLISMEGQPIQ